MKKIIQRELIFLSRQLSQKYNSQTGEKKSRKKIIFIF